MDRHESVGTSTTIIEKETPIVAFRMHGKGVVEYPLESAQLCFDDDIVELRFGEGGPVRIYLGGPMFVQAEVEYNLRLASKVRELGMDVYCPNESEPINDKTRDDVTPRVVYDFDIEELKTCNVMICQVSEDSGTNWEAGFMDCLSRLVDPSHYYGVIGLATDIRLKTAPNPAQIGVENQAWHINALVAGGLQSSLGVYLDEPSLFARLIVIRNEREGAA